MLQTQTTTQKILLISWVVKGKIALGNTSFCKPKLMSCVRNVEFLGMTLKTRVQEEVEGPNSKTICLLSDSSFLPSPLFQEEASKEIPRYVVVAFGSIKLRLSCHYPKPLIRAAWCRYLLEIMTFYVLKNSAYI